MHLFTQKTKKFHAKYHSHDKFDRRRCGGTWGERGNGGPTMQELAGGSGGRVEGGKNVRGGSETHFTPCNLPYTFYKGMHLNA